PSGGSSCSPSMIWLATMADWSAYVRHRLSLPTLRPEREAEVVEDLARQLDEAYREAIAAGTTEAEALTRAEQHVPDWDALARQIGASSRQRKAAVDRWQEHRDEYAIATRGRLSL